MADDELVLEQWEQRIRMLPSARLWKMFLLVLGLPALGLGILVAFLAGPATGALAGGGAFLLFAALWFLVGVVVDLGGGFSARYTLTDRGVYFASGKGARTAATAAVVGGLLKGSAAATGAGLLARAEQDAFLAWKDITRASVNADDLYIELRGRSATKPIGLHCTAENFGRVGELLRGKVSAVLR